MKDTQNVNLVDLLMETNNLKRYDYRLSLLAIKLFAHKQNGAYYVNSVVAELITKVKCLDKVLVLLDQAKTRRDSETTNNLPKKYNNMSIESIALEIINQNK